jgi:hypothetical protein
VSHVNVDLVAERLAMVGAMAKSMPPSWKGAGISQPFCGPRGEYLGRVLPGRGLYLDCDLKSDSYSETVGIPLYTNNPGAALDQTSVGALSGPLFAPSGSNTAYLLSLGHASNVGSGTSSGWHIAIVIDALVGIGGLPLNSSPTTITSAPALTRYTTGAGVMMTLIAQTNVNNLPTSNATISYTNQAGSAGRSAVMALDNDIELGGGLPFDPVSLANLAFFPLQTGDFGVRTVASLTLSGLDTAAETAAILLYYPLTFLGLSGANTDYVEYEFSHQPDFLPPLQVSSGKLGCLGVFRFSNSSTAPSNTNQQITLRIVQG